MTRIQLFIEGKRVDLFEDDTIEIKQYIKDFKQIDKVFTDYTKPFNVPASANNNIIFKHFYDYKIKDGFDARVQIPAEIHLNHQVFKRGKIFLEGVDLKNKVAHTYRLQFYGNTVSLKDRFGEDTLATLDLLDFDHTYDYSTVKDIFKGSGFTANSDSNAPGYIVSGDTEALIYPLITPKKRLFYDSSLQGTDKENYDGNLYRTTEAGHSNARGITHQDLKPAIKVYYLIKAIEDRYNLVMIPNDTSGTEDFFSRHNDAISNLYMWISNRSGKLSGQNDGDGYFYKHPLLGNLYTQTTDTDDDYDWFTQTNGVFKISKDFTQQTLEKGGRSRRGFVFKIKTLIPLNSDNIPYEIRLVRNSDKYVLHKIEATGDVAYELDPDLLQVPNTEDQEFYIEVQSESPITSNAYVTFEVVMRKNIARGVLNEDREGYRAQIDTTSNTTIGLRDFISADMKIIDFIGGLMKMFNLVAYYIDDQSDSEYSEDSLGNPNTIKFITLDKFYAKATSNTSGGIIDVTDFVDVTQHSVNTSLPFSEVSFKYEDNNTVIRTNHTALSPDGKVFGNATRSLLDMFKRTQVFVGESFNVQLPFTILKYEHLIDLGDSDNPNTGIQWGYAAGGDFQTTEADYNSLPYTYPTGDYQAENIKPLLFYAIRTTLTGSYSIQFRNEGKTSSEGITTYYRPSNSNETITKNSDSEFSDVSDYQLTFNAELEEYSNFMSTNSLIKVFYEKYLESVFNANKRVFIFSAFLPPRVLTILKLNDQLKIHDTIYRINSIVTSLKTGKSKLELINLEADEVIGTAIIARHIFIN